MAALQGQDAEIEEAARLDGARWSQIFWNVSLPLMRPVIAVALVLRGIDIVTMFASVFIITGGTPGGATETMSYFIYRIGFKTFNFGYASAVSVVMLIADDGGRAAVREALLPVGEGLDMEAPRHRKQASPAASGPPVLRYVILGCLGARFAWRRSCGSCRSGFGPRTEIIAPRPIFWPTCRSTPGIRSGPTGRWPLPAQLGGGGRGQVVIDLLLAVPAASSLARYDLPRRAKTSASTSSRPG